MPHYWNWREVQFEPVKIFGKFRKFRVCEPYATLGHVVAHYLDL